MSDNFSALARITRAKIDRFRKRDEKPARRPPLEIRPGAMAEIDESPLILAGEALKLVNPGGRHQISGVSEMETGDGRDWYRAYLDGVAGFLEISADGREVRLFTLIDEVLPASPEEWEFWLDEQDGYIGYPVFETKDGTAWQRAWLPGDSRVHPVEIAENFTGQAGDKAETEHFAMLYRRATGLVAPAPQTEYLLVAAVQDEGGACVEILAGIDLNPAAVTVL